MTITEIKSQLPYGSVREIARRTKLSVCTISEVLSGKRKSTKETIILNAIADYLAEHKRAEQEARQKLDTILNE